MLDEPTAALGVAQTRQVLDLILRLKERGLAVIVISHNLADVFEVADRIVVLSWPQRRGLRADRDHPRGGRPRHHQRTRHPGRRGRGRR